MQIARGKEFESEELSLDLIRAARSGQPPEVKAEENTEMKNSTRTSPDETLSNQLSRPPSDEVVQA